MVLASIVAGVEVVEVNTHVVVVVDYLKAHVIFVQQM